LAFFLVHEEKAWSFLASLIPLSFYMLVILLGFPYGSYYSTNFCIILSVVSLFTLDLFLILAIVFLLLVLSMIWPPDSPWAPWWRTGDRQIRESLKLAKVTKKDTVYELGSGDGRFLVIAAKEFGARGVGIEIDPVRYYISKFRVKANNLNSDVTIIKKNFFDVDISKASVIFVYLVPKALGRLLPKFKKELRKGTRIVSYRYEINLPLEKFDKENEIRLYVL